MPTNGITLAIVDAGPLYAAADRSDSDHQRCVATLRRPELHLIIPVLVIAEVTYMLARRLGAAAEAAFLRGLRGFDIEAPAADDLARMAELVDQYADFPLGSTDASVIALAERLRASALITLDRRHFGVIRPALNLLPD